MTDGLTLTSHTVDTARGLMAGFLVRTAGRQSLGYIWTAGGVWRWRTMSGANFGERTTKRAALDVLADIAKKPAVRLPFDDAPPPSDADILSAWRTVGPTRAAPRPSVATPAPAPRQVVWNDDATHDLTAAVAAALKGGK